MSFCNETEVYDETDSKLLHLVSCKLQVVLFVLIFNPFAPGDFAEKRVLKLVEWFSGHCRAIKS